MYKVIRKVRKNGHQTDTIITTKNCSIHESMQQGGFANQSLSVFVIFR